MWRAGELAEPGSVLQGRDVGVAVEADCEGMCLWLEVYSVVSGLRNPLSTLWLVAEVADYSGTRIGFGLRLAETARISVSRPNRSAAPSDPTSSEQASFTPTAAPPADRPLVEHLGMTSTAVRPVRCARKGSTSPSA